MMKFNFTHENILLALAKYKYLTVSQLTNLGIMKDKRNVSKKVKELRDRGLVKSIAYGFTPKIGRVENVNHLSVKGKNILMDDLEMEEDEIRMPIGRSNTFFKDYFHRRSTIDFHINLENWAGQSEVQVLLFDTYFDKLGNNRRSKNLRAKTKVDLPNGYIIPDAVFMIESVKSEKELYLVEVYNGKDTLRTLKQLKKHAEVISIGSVNEKYDFHSGYRVLSVFEHESMMEAVIERMSEDQYFKNLKAHFLFKSIADLAEGNFMENWFNFQKAYKKAI